MILLNNNFFQFFFFDFVKNQCNDLTYYQFLMGSDQSHQIQPQSSIILKISDALKLTFNEQQGITNALIYKSYADTLSRTDKGIINRSMSPFCTIQIGEIKTKSTTCLISPIMAIACAKSLIKYQKSSDVFLVAICQGIVHHLSVQNLVRIGTSQFCLLILKQPFWKVGWTGLSFLQDIGNLPKLVKIITHSLTTKSQNGMLDQQMKKMIPPKFVFQEEPLKIKSLQNQQGIAWKIIKKKPYVIGINSQDKQLTFLSKKDIMTINKISLKYLKEDDRQKNIMKQMDIVEYQMKTMW